jgi:hypothetical protein
MSRAILGLVAAALAVSVSGQAIAADWGATSQPMFKPAYPVDMAPMEDDIDFEAGLRYFYGMGGQNLSTAGQTYSADDASHFVELHGRINDRSTNTYLSGNLGYAAAIDGTFRTPASGVALDTNAGTIAYGGADFGYLPFGNQSGGLGGFVGYQYLNESIDTGRASFLTSGGGGDSESNRLEIHGLRLGVTGQAKFNDVIDFRVDAAAIPYAMLTGVHGAFNGLDLINPGGGVVRGNAATISGHLYGAAIDAMVGFKATENMKIRAGARGYYLTGPTETYFELRDSGAPGTAQGFRTTGTAEFFRWGPVIELTGTF